MKFKPTPFFTYLVTGGLNTLISLAIYILMLHWGVYYLFASGFTYVFGIVEGYIFSCLFVFKRRVKFTGLIKYSGIYGVTLFLNLALIYTWVDLLQVDKVLAQILNVITLTALNYQAVKLLLFQQKSGTY